MLGQRLGVYEIQGCETSCLTVAVIRLHMKPKSWYTIYREKASNVIYILSICGSAKLLKKMKSTKNTKNGTLIEVIID